MYMQAFNEHTSAWVVLIIVASSVVVGNLLEVLQDPPSGHNSLVLHRLSSERVSLMSSYRLSSENNDNSYNQVEYTDHRGEC